ncbi:hypothetical protein GmHk_12G034666 [Glycine max]|nr:hypothetical protein GmHk_12G034666 [Glycine max]
MQSQGLALPPKPEVGSLAACVSTKESCVDPSGKDLDTGDSEKCGLYVEENPPRLEGLKTVHNIPLRHDQVKVGVEEVRDADTTIPVPTKEVKLVGQTLNTFFVWPTHLVKRAVRPAKPVDRPDHDVDDLLYLMTLTIPQLFLKPLQHVVVNVLASLLYSYEFCKSIYIVVYYLTYCFKFIHNSLYFKNNRHMTETTMRAGNADVYGFLKPQSIQRSGQSHFESEKLDDTPQSKSKVAARWIIVKYFNDARPLKPERLKALRIRWATYYLKVKNETISI